MSEKIETFSDQLIEAIKQKRSTLVVGLDPHLALMPPALTNRVNLADRNAVSKLIMTFCVGILDATADVVAAVKPQVAFFERLGPPGIEALEQIVCAAKKRGLLVISDSKRGDIGSTASAYADYHLGSGEADASQLPGLGADAITLNAYLGEDSLAPFADYVAKGRGLFILAKSSNKGSSNFQDRDIQYNGDRGPLYRAVAALAETLSNRYSFGRHGYSSIGIVVGATFPQQANELRKEFPRLFFLVPGIGAQGAQPSDIKGCFNSDGLGAVVNASRSILFAYREGQNSQIGNSWQEDARISAISLRDQLNTALN